jgi:hypothetical protein
MLNLKKNMNYDTYETPVINHLYTGFTLCMQSKQQTDTNRYKQQNYRLKFCFKLQESRSGTTIPQQMLNLP